MAQGLHDPEVDRKVLLDHIIIISANEITKPAKEWLVGMNIYGHPTARVVRPDQIDFLPAMPKEERALCYR